MKILAGLSALQRYVLIGLAAALAASILANGILVRTWLGARDDVAAAVERCNAQKAQAVAEAEKIVRQAQERAAAAKIAQLQAQIAREAAAAASEREKRVQAEVVAAERQNELRRLAEGVFDEDDVPDSNACLNAYLSSHALRCVLHARADREAGGGSGSGGDALCADPQGADGVHPGFSNVTYLDALLYWGADRDAAQRWNERAVEIRRIQNELVDFSQ